jgi:stearoyl-CoA desaturase (delta-9 desaturase)
MSTIAYYVGLIALLSLLFTTSGWYVYLPMVFAIYVLGTITVSVGYHRLFCHHAFKTSRFWHWFFATSGVMFMYSSPLQWVVTHATHHKHSDTSRDPHPTPMQALVVRGYRDVPLDTWRSRKLLRLGLLHVAVDKYYVPIYFAGLAVLCAISLDFVLYAYLPALGLAHLAGGLHNLLSHSNGKPRDLPFMEFILPAAGEWLHGTHHKHAGRWDFRTKPWHFDLGALVVKAIRSPA